MNASPSVILINSFTVPEGKLDDAIKSWESGRDFLAQQPSYISSKLHQSLSPDAQYQLINVAEWETPEAFKEAITAMRASSKFPPVEGLVSAPALYNVIRN
jgi:heme-degrading monooxygenase HmoA